LDTYLLLLESFDLQAVYDFLNRQFNFPLFMLLFGCKDIDFYLV